MLLVEENVDEIEVEGDGSNITKLTSLLLIVLICELVLLDVMLEVPVPVVSLRATKRANSRRAVGRRVNCGSLALPCGSLCMAYCKTPIRATVTTKKVASDSVRRLAGL